MLLNLPDDCLHEIFNYFDLQDCLVMADVSRELRNFTLNRLQSCGFDYAYWKQHYVHKPVPKHLKRLMARTTGEIKCNGDFLHSIRTYFNRLEFTGVTSLKLTAYNFEPIAADELEHLVSDLFPRLEQLTLYGDFQGNFIWYLKNLKSLEIDTRAFDEDSIENLKMISLKKLSLKRPLKDWPVLKELTKLHELQELQLCANDYTQFALNSGFKLLKKLNKLILTPTEEGFHMFFKDSDYYRKIDSIQFNMRLGKQDVIEQRFLSDMTRLRKLYFNNDDGSTLREFCKTDPKAWQTIEEIYYINAECKTDNDLEQQQEDLLDLVKHTPNLAKLDISGSEFGDDLLKRIFIIFHAQSRNKVLLLHCHNTKLTPNTQRTFLPKQLTLCFEDQFHQTKGFPTPNAVEINFKEPHSIEDAILYLGELLEIISRICDVKYLWDVLHEKKQKLQRIRNEEFILESIKDISEERLAMWRALLLDVRENMYRQVEIITEMVLSYTFLN